MKDPSPVCYLIIQHHPFGCLFYRFPRFGFVASNDISLRSPLFLPQNMLKKGSLATDWRIFLYIFYDSLLIYILCDFLLCCYWHFLCSWRITEFYEFFFHGSYRTCHVESGVVLGLAWVIFQVESGVLITDHLCAVGQPRRQALAVRSHSRRFSVRVYFFKSTSVGVCYSSEEAFWQYGLSWSHCIWLLFLVYYDICQSLNFIKLIPHGSLITLSISSVNSPPATLEIKWNLTICWYTSAYILE